VVVNVNDYDNVPALIKWLDIDPQFDPIWIDWIFKRPFAYCPGLSNIVRTIGRIDYNRAVVDASELGYSFTSNDQFKGVINDARLSQEQIKISTGVMKMPNGHLRPARLDKMILTIYSLNKALERSALSPQRPKIFISAYNISGLSGYFSGADSKKKEELRKILSSGTKQSEAFCGDFLKGNKATLDFTIAAYNIVTKELKSDPDLQEKIPKSLDSAIETPSQKFTQAANGENFTESRQNSLPPGFRR